jgi:hypothetical protein
MIDLNKKRLLLSRKNMGRKIILDCIAKLQEIGLVGITTESFLDIENSDSFLNKIVITDFSKVDFCTSNKAKYCLEIDDLNLPDEIFVFLKQTEFIGLLKVRTDEFIKYSTEILESFFFGGYVTIYSIEGDKMVEFDFEPNEYSMTKYSINN